MDEGHPKVLVRSCPRIPSYRTVLSRSKVQSYSTAQSRHCRGHDRPILFQEHHHALRKLLSQDVDVEPTDDEKRLAEEKDPEKRKEVVHEAPSGLHRCHVLFPISVRFHRMGPVSQILVHACDVEDREETFWKQMRCRMASSMFRAIGCCLPWLRYDCYW